MSRLLKKDFNKRWTATKFGDLQPGDIFRFCSTGIMATLRAMMPIDIEYRVSVYLTKLRKYKLKSGAMYVSFTCMNQTGKIIKENHRVANKVYVLK